MWYQIVKLAFGALDSATLAASGSGVVSAGTLRVVLATDVALPAGTNNIGDVDVLTLPALVAGTANIGDVDVLTLPALVAGTANIGDVDVLTIAAGSTLIGDVGLQGRTSGGLTIFRSLDLDETEEEIKATAGQVYTIYGFNATVAILYLKFYNATAATVVVGTTTPVLTLPLPGNNDSDGGGIIWTIPQGLAFGTAITAACTTGIADTDVGAPAANACVVNVGYQ